MSLGKNVCIVPYGTKRPQPSSKDGKPTPSVKYEIPVNSQMLRYPSQVIYPNIKGLLEEVCIGKSYNDVGLVPRRMNSGLSQIIFTELFPVK